jgi:hypothetical protein
MMNRYEAPRSQGEARLRYLDGEVQIVMNGAFVRCAVTGMPIPLDELKYWSVEWQEPYIDAAASFQRYRANRA